MFAAHRGASSPTSFLFYARCLLNISTSRNWPRTTSGCSNLDLIDRKAIGDGRMTVAHFMTMNNSTQR